MIKLISFYRDKKKNEWNNFRKELVDLIPDVEYFERIPGYKETEFKVGNTFIQMFCEENYLKRTKFMRSYNTYIKIYSPNEKIMNDFKMFIEKSFDKKSYLVKKKIIINITKSKNRIKFIEFMKSQIIVIN